MARNLFALLGAGLAFAEGFLEQRGQRYAWALRATFVIAGVYLEGVLKQKLGIKEGDETEEDGKP